uniref:NADH dehydrogenase subunit 6 n=1 Tax=Rediviva intermixta TaxID=1688786 RepID=A0A172CI86_9HYME|nr:NADH dehydrogenase subunit 6 [Rediviva intermixta]AKS40065.1 NADH dehydrogenase subunit 6 [Rediviva intermixta]
MFMKIILLFFILTILLYSILMNNIHPLNYMMLLVIFTFLMVLMNYCFMGKILYSMIIMITITGGVMVMFLYFSSLINNEKSLTNKFEFNMFIAVMVMFLIIMLFFSNKMNWYMYLNNNNNNIVYMYMIYMKPYYIATMICMFNLLYCLILTIKSCSNKYLPLRKL